MPTEQIYVLADLSETWHNLENDERNERVLSEIGYGIAAVADDVDPPFAVQHYIIGKASLQREPACDALYLPSIAPTKAKVGDYVIRKPKRLRQYLGIDCPMHLVGRPAEPLTEISAAIESVATQPAGAKTKRTMIIASDFLEETVGVPDLSADLSKFKVLMVYRPIQDDRAYPRGLRQRVKEWRQTLERHGATVTVQPDTALKRATISSYLRER